MGTASRAGLSPRSRAVERWGPAQVRGLQGPRPLLQAGGCRATYRSCRTLGGDVSGVTHPTFQTATLPWITVAGRTLPGVTALLPWVVGQGGESVLSRGVIFSSVADPGTRKRGTGCFPGSLRFPRRPPGSPAAPTLVVRRDT